MKRRRLLFSLALAACVALLWGVVTRDDVLAYNEAGHFYTAVAISHDAIHAFASTDRNDAVLVAYCAQVPDLTGDFDAVSQFLKVNVYPAGILKLSPLTWGAFSACWTDDAKHMASVHQFLHGLTDSDAELLSQAALKTYKSLRDTANGDANKLCAAGFAVHLLGDSYAHRRLGKDSTTYAAGIGHGFDGVTPDQLSYVDPDNKKSRVPLWLKYIDALAGKLGALAQANRVKLEELATKHPTDGSGDGNSKANVAIIKGLRQELDPDDQLPAWAPYKPTIEEMSDSLITTRSFQDAVHPVAKLGSVTRNGVWGAYLSAAVPAFTAQGIKTKCKPETVNNQ